MLPTSAQRSTQVLDADLTGIMAYMEFFESARRCE